MSSRRSTTSVSSSKGACARPNDENVLRDDSRIWALEFSDGLLLLSAPASSMTEAELILSASRRGE